MKIQEVEQLLEKFYKGEASRAEEARLEQFFLSEELPDKFKAERDIFTWRSLGQEEFVPDAQLENDILKTIQGSEMKKLASKNSFQNQLYWLSGIAATLLIIMGAYFGFIRTQQNDSFENPELAYMETKKVLYYVSSKLNKGTEPVNESMKKYHKGTLEMRKIGEMNKAIDEMKTVSELPSGINALKYFNLLQDPGIMISKYTLK